MLKRIMQVDDDVDILEISKLALEDFGGFELLQMSTGVGAVEAAERFDPGLILLDVMMPEVTGEQLFFDLRSSQLLREVPVVFMTAKGNQQSCEHLLELGAADVVVKPFDPIGLSDHLRILWKSQAT